MPLPKVDRESISSTYELIRPHIRRTPVVEVEGSDFGLNGSNLILKLESAAAFRFVQGTGSFHQPADAGDPRRGSRCRIGRQSRRGGGVCCHEAEAPARIFVPEVASPAKLERIRGYGADLVVTGERYADALAASEEWAAQSGALAIHAFEQVETLLGQGTVGLEFEKSISQPRYVFWWPLVAAASSAALPPGIGSTESKFVGVEPEAAPTLTRALEAGRPVDAEAGGIAADSLAPKRVGEMMFPIAQAHVKNVLLVSDDSIRRSAEGVVEGIAGGGGTGRSSSLAALLSRRYQPQPGERVGVLVCGGNTTAVDFRM